MSEVVPETTPAIPEGDKAEPAPQGPRVFDIVHPEKMSKNKRKKMERHKKWIEGKAERRKREREKEKARRAKKRLEATENKTLMVTPKPMIKMADSKCKISVVIDCDYGQFMGEDLIRKFCKQINRCYSINRKSEMPVQLYLTSVNGNVKEAIDTYQPGHTNWDCNITNLHWEDLFVKQKGLDKNNLIYLSGDSDKNTPELKDIQESENMVFIIGGLLDHNQHKGLSLKRAKSFGIQHAKLPIGDHIKMCQRKILSIPHVFEIMLLASNGSSGQEWAEIFEKVIPARKIAPKDDKPDPEVNMEVDQPKENTETAEMKEEPTKMEEEPAVVKKESAEQKN